MKALSAVLALALLLAPGAVMAGKGSPKDGKDWKAEKGMRSGQAERGERHWKRMARKL